METSEGETIKEQRLSLDHTLNVQRTLGTDQEEATLAEKLYRKDTKQKSEVCCYREMATTMVSFSTVEFHEHAMILGCSPSTSQGPPIEIGWESLGSICVSLDEYEEIRAPRRGKHAMAMPASVRESLYVYYNRKLMGR